nr:hypothetical protein GCM10017611_47130 [Rhodococcus wratislaviensis]
MARSGHRQGMALRHVTVPALLRIEHPPIDVAHTARNRSDARTQDWDQLAAILFDACASMPNPAQSPHGRAGERPQWDSGRRLQTGRNRHPARPPTPHNPGTHPPPPRRRRPHITNREHVITAGHSTITPAGADVASIPPITTYTPPRMGSREFSRESRRSRRRPGRERVMVFERFSDQTRQVVVLAAGAARTHHPERQH